MMNKKLVRPTDAEDAQITTAALADPDNPPLTDEELQQSKAKPQVTAGSPAE
jgi:hypothetical protein